MISGRVGDDVIPITTAQIGRCGELLVQYQLLKFGVESAPMTTDRGIDIVAFSPGTQRAVTIQVKTNLRPKKAGGRGKLALDWWIPSASPAHSVALVDLARDDVWLFTHQELVALSQQKPKGRLHFYFYTGSDARVGRLKLASAYERFKLECRIKEIFGDNA